MHIITMSIRQAKEYIPPEPEHTALISISDAIYKPEHSALHTNIDLSLYKSYCILQFDDVYDMPSAQALHLKMINTQDIQKILDFINQIREQNIKLLVIHCYYGESRSPAVALAVQKILGGDFSYTLDHIPYKWQEYNPFVFRRIIEKALDNDGGSL